MAIVAGLAGCGQPQVAQPLPALGADITKTSVSGLSAGAYMAGQFHLAYSDIVIGAGLIAGGPWGCAQSAFADRMPGPGQIFINVQLAINGCMHNQLQAWGVPNAGRLAERARKFAQAGRIDPLAAVAGDRIYLFAGRKEHVHFARARVTGDLSGELNQFVGLVATCAHNDDDVVTFSFCFNRAAGCASNFFSVGHTGATKFLHNDCHVLGFSCDIGRCFV